MLLFTFEVYVVLFHLQLMASVLLNILKISVDITRHCNHSFLSPHSLLLTIITTITVINFHQSVNPTSVWTRTIE
jgi:hypothetical protein